MKVKNVSHVIGYTGDESFQSKKVTDKTREVAMI